MSDMGWREAIIQVLRDEDEPMHYADIADAIAERGLRSDIGATPTSTVAAVISMSIRNDGEYSPFVRVSRGHYALRERQFDASSATAAEEDASEETGLINAFGMFWRRDFVLWSTSPKLLGRQQPNSEPVDFADQKGVYLLHDGNRVVYVGRTTEQTLATRLKQHTVDRLNGRWDRFSWFGVYPVNDNGSLTIRIAEEFNVDSLITTMEAVLIESLEPAQNRRRGDEFRAVEFLQVQDPAIQKSHIIELMDRLKEQL